MTHAFTYDMAADIVDRAAGLTPNSATHTVRHARDKVAVATQGSYEALFDPALQGGLTLTERLRVALHACRLTPAPELAAHYEERLRAQGVALEAPGDARLQAILDFTRTLIERPVEGDRAALHALPEAGLSTPAVVALSQLIAFLSYQTRLVAGLKAMKALEAAQ